ncbi:hypothetical protein N2152v2_005441 [Parachlorella kessleri]
MAGPIGAHRRRAWGAAAREEGEGGHGRRDGGGGGHPPGASAGPGHPPWGPIRGVDKDSSIETFWVQVFISLTLIIFTIVMLATGHDTSVYLPILSATVGYWLPAPARKAPASAVDSSVAAAGGSQMTVPNSADGEGPHPTHNNGASGSPAPRPNTPPDHERMPLRNDIEEARAAAH